MRSTQIESPSRSQINSQFNRRLLALLTWAFLMLATMAVVTYIDLRLAKFVPIFFLPLMVPILIFPFKGKPGRDH